MQRFFIKKIIPVIIIAVFSFACDKFLSKETQKMLKEYETATYITITDISAGNKSLKKGIKIKINLLIDKSWIKVYGYPAEVDELVADKVLMLYLFSDNFKDEKFNKELFDKQLFEKIKKVGP